jgi:arginyl-tRNA synthetase
MSTVADLLTDLVQRAAATAGYADAPLPMEPVVPVGDRKFGDYQSNFGFRLGKALRTAPRPVAAAIAEALPAHPAIAKVEVAGAGFINFFLDDQWLGAEVLRRAADARMGTPSPGEGRALVIDYSSPNIAKRMHVGHMRSTIIGHTLDALYRFLGYRVVSDNHVGDWGTQFGKLIVAWHRWRDQAAYEADPIGELQRIYQLFGAMAEQDPALADLARAETVRLQEGDPANRALWEELVAVSMREFDVVYRRLGVRFDVVLGESFYRDELVALVDDLLARGLAIHNEGAVIVPFTEEDGKGLDNSPLLVRKSDGASLYGTTDLATVRHRVRTWNPEVIVYVTDVRQQLHFRQVFAAARKIGFDVDFRHVWFGMLRFPDGAIAATRGGGELVNLADLLDEAVVRARALVDEGSPDLSAEERAEIAEAVGTGAVRYADLSQNPQSDVIFEWDKMLAMQGNTAPYLMYAHARCRSILRRAEAGGEQAGEIVLGHPLERELALALVQLPEIILVAGQTARPNLLCDHVYVLAQAFARFFSSCPVLKEGVEPSTRASRLSLVQATAQALALGLGLLGIRALPRM